MDILRDNLVQSSKNKQVCVFPLSYRIVNKYKIISLLKEGSLLNMSEVIFCYTSSKTTSSEKSFDVDEVVRSVFFSKMKIKRQPHNLPWIKRVINILKWYVCGMLASRYVAVSFESFSLVFFQERGILRREIKQSVNWVKDVRMLTPRILNRQLNEKTEKWDKC